MTDQLFHEARRQPPPSAAERLGRWVLHRAGLLNVWQYDRAELAFAGGRALLRGKNGAGKSKALELLLPFVLDGDTRAIDAAGRDRTTIRWLMTDGRDPGHHIGYAWLELRLTDHDGQESFCTVGAGLRASTSTSGSDTWYFISDRRVGIDLALDVGGECLSVPRLKEAVGEDRVVTSAAEHRRRVASQLFGLRDEGRYANLIHLLHRLRDPNIGNQVEAGDLAKVLSEALPPLDDQVVQDAASRFDDLDLVKRQLEETERTAAALGRFLDAYRGYTRGVLRERAGAVGKAEQTRRTAVNQARTLGEAAAYAERALEAAREEVKRLRAEEREALREGEALKDSEDYRTHRVDLAQRRETVVAIEGQSRLAADTAETATRQRDEAMADESEARSSLQTALRRAATARADLGGPLAAAGLDPALLVVPAVDGAGELDDSALARSQEAAKTMASLLDSRRRTLDAVRSRGAAAGDAAERARLADEQAERSEAEAVERTAAVEQAEEWLRDVSQTWADEVRAWCHAGPDEDAALDWSPALGLVAEIPVPREDLGGVAEMAVATLSPMRAAAGRDVVAAALARAQHLERLDLERRRYSALAAEQEARPEPSRFQRAEREAAAGAALFELVDVKPGVDAAARAGIEAALEAAGLLDAWVTADGIVAHPRTEDVLVRADLDPLPPGTPTLADLLAPAEIHAPVSVEIVDRVLSRIALGEHPGLPTWVSPDGRWALGTLRGSWSKRHGEYLGAGARRATRQRRLEELAGEIARLESDLAQAEEDLQAAEARRQSLDEWAARFPTSDAVVDAHADVDAFRKVAGDARARHEQDRKRAERARSAAARARAEFEQHAARDGLPAELEALDGMLAALAEARSLLPGFRQRLEAVTVGHGQLRGLVARVTTRTVEAKNAARQAGVLRDEAAGARAALTTLEAAVGQSVRETLERLGTVRRRIEQLAQEQPGAEDAERAAAEQCAEASLLHQQAEDKASDLRADVIAAADRLRRAVALPGVALAALGSGWLEERTPEGSEDALRSAVALGRALAGQVADGEEVTDRFILARYDELDDALVGGYDVAADEEDGVKVFHVADDAGRQPLPVVATRVAEEAASARDRLLEREREVLERFLLRELGDELRDRLLEAVDLVTEANRALASVRTSHGKGARLEWVLREEAATDAATAAVLLVDALRSEEDDARLRDALLHLIREDRDRDPEAGYEEHLRQALDYRLWHQFDVRVVDDSRPGSARKLSGRAGLSQGEQRVVSYLALFAAAAAHFNALARATPEVPRLLLLDDAFAKIDEPTHGRLLKLLIDLDLDFLITSERLWGCFPEVPSLEIYEALRDPNVPGVALVHFHWDGHQRHLIGL
jgi:uncharacterized protein (TIGR02680 family)